MPPLASLQFQRAAAQQFTAAEVPFDQGLNLDAKCLAGYTVEYALKAMILAKTPPAEVAKQTWRITAGKRTHEPAVLRGVLKELGVELPDGFGDRLRRGVGRRA